MTRYVISRTKELPTKKLGKLIHEPEAILVRIVFSVFRALSGRVIVLATLIVVLVAAMHAGGLHRRA